MLYVEHASVYGYVEFGSVYQGTKLTENDECSRSESGTASNRRRRVRADARRNVDAILRVATKDFAGSGVDVPMREIAERAGVGIGTLYRHFPTRSDLIVAVFRHEVDECVAAVSTLAANYRPGDALSRWVEQYVDFIAAHRGLAAALNSGDPALEGLPAYFQQCLRPAVQGLLDAAAAAGEIRAGVMPHELIHAIAMLCVPSHCGEPTDPRRMVGLLIDGLRYGVRR